MVMDRLESWRSELADVFWRGSRQVYEFADEHRLVTCTVTAVCGLVVIRWWMHGGQCRSKVQLTGKTALVTGANTGIGKETARDLAKRGARVLIACRDMTKAEAAAEEIRQSTGNQDVVTYKLDLASLKSVRQCASGVLAKEKRLDILINNAGIMWTPQWTTEDGYEMQFATNHLGHFLLTNLLLDLIKKSTPSRIVTVSSAGHMFAKCINFDDINCTKDYTPVMAYSKSKLANILFSRELAKRLIGSNVTSNSLNPGFVATDLWRHSDSYSGIVKLIFHYWYNFMLKFMVKTSKDGAQTSIYLAVSEDVEGVTGKYFSDCAVAKETKAAQDDEAAARLWTISEEMTGLKKS